MIRMDEFNKIRKAYFADKLSINEIADKFKRSWATVHKIINTPREDEFSTGERKLTRVSKVATQEVMDAISDIIQEELLLKVKKKQRSTATVIFEELTKKGVYQGSQRRMQELVKATRQKLSQTEPESFLPLDFPHGSIAQIDHGEVDCIIDKERRTCFLFVLAVPGSGLRYCQLFATKSQEAWGEFHERAFRFFNGIFPRTMYDNDTVLVKYSKERTVVASKCPVYAESIRVTSLSPLELMHPSLGWFDRWRDSRTNTCPAKEENLFGVFQPENSGK